ncbi:hypothetical protein [Thalassolituus pacificus]|uniref:LPP20 lipoprotein n=1 Tax=Thalassolituus pacificus TaxID=2975440 RepID=A0A9X2WH18_9GAMM|nr:hypothetical protein [Thalassolituus pacificus]MCT7360128.1 hypothetical protein [Thalassolituus pacificus]
MSMMKKTGLSAWLLMAALLLGGCAGQPRNGGAPDWIMNPGSGVVASCGFNIKGRYAQEQCALMRARERLAAQQGVEISSVSYLSERMRNDASSVSLNKETLEKVSGVTVKARIRDTWYDAQRDEYYVWLESH